MEQPHRNPLGGAVRASITLGVETVRTEVEVNDSATLVDQSRTGSLYSIGQQAINEQLSAQPGRSLSDLVNDQPGWLYEANGTLHREGPNTMCNMCSMGCR